MPQSGSLSRTRIPFHNLIIREGGFEQKKIVMKTEIEIVEQEKRG